jgi:hypothetical protein
MPAGRQRRTPPPERSVWGLTILSPSHPEVRRLRQAAVQPTLHGHKIWPTSLVLLDYLHQRGLPPQTRVLELKPRHDILATSVHLSRPYRPGTRGCRETVRWTTTPCLCICCLLMPTFLQLPQPFYAPLG